MQCYSVLIALLSWAAVEAANIRIEQSKISSISVETRFTVNGTPEHETIILDKTSAKEIPQGATNISLTVYEHSSGNLIGSRNYPELSDDKCFAIRYQDFQLHFVETLCLQLPREGPEGPAIQFRNNIHDQSGWNVTAVEIKFKLDNLDLSEAAEDIKLGENKTIQLPEGAIDIHVTFYRGPGSGNWGHKVASQHFFSLKDKKCFSYNCFVDEKVDWLEEPCEMPEFQGGSRVTVRNMKPLPIVVKVTYELDMHSDKDSPFPMTDIHVFGESTGQFFEGETRTIEIPREGKKITVEAYEWSSRQPYQSFGQIIFNKAYTYPIIVELDAKDTGLLEKPGNTSTKSSISFLQTEDYKVMFHIRYQYGYKLSDWYYHDTSEEFSMGEMKTVSFPTLAHDIDVTLYKFPFFHLSGKYLTTNDIIFHRNYTQLNETLCLEIPSYEQCRSPQAKSSMATYFNAGNPHILLTLLALLWKLM